MFGKCWEASRVSLVNVVGSKEYEIFYYSLSSNHICQEKCEASQHLPNIYQENMRLLGHLPNIYLENLWFLDVHVLQCRKTT